MDWHALVSLPEGTSVLSHLSQLLSMASAFQVPLHRGNYFQEENVLFTMRGKVNSMRQLVQDRWVDKILYIQGIEINEEYRGKQWIAFVLGIFERISAQTGHTLLIECVINERFAAILSKHGFICLDPSVSNPSFIKNF